MSKDGTSSLLNRRTILKTIGVGVPAAGFLGGTVSGNEYDDVVDIVEAGADDTGEEPIDDVFASHANDDTRIEFPDGRYKVNDITLYGLRNFAMIATGDATLVPGENYEPRSWIAGTNNRYIRFENFTIDNTEDGVGSTVIIHAYDGLIVRNVTKIGHHDVNRPAFGFRVIEDGGSGLVESLQAADGGRSVGIYTDPDGTITYRNCHLERFENNGLYASLGTGPVHIEGGFYRNNNVSAVRLGTDGSSVRGATFRVDDPPSDFGNCRGIRLADGAGPVEIENCELYMTSGRGTGAIVGAFNSGSFSVRDTAIYVGPEYSTVGSGGRRTSYAIYVDPATDGEVGSRTIENTVIKGAGDYVAPVRLARDNNDLRDLCIEQSGHRRNGIIFVDSNNNVVEDSSISVPGEEIVLEGDSSVERSNISTDAECEWPNGVGDNGDDEVEADEPEESSGEADDPDESDGETDDTSEGSDRDEDGDVGETLPEGDVITIVGDSETAHYEFTVDGSVEKSTAYGGTINDYDEINEMGTVTGRTTNEPDSYAFDGVITDFKTTDVVTVLLNGEELSPQLIGPSVLTVVGTGRTAYYEFEVTGNVQKSTAYGGTINDYDQIRDDGTVSGRTTNEPDSFSCIGMVRSFKASGPVEIYADGELVTEM